MNPGNHDPDGFDQRMRQLHATAVEQVSPQVRARLRTARHAAGSGQAVARRGAWPWLAAGFASALLAVAIGVQWLPGNAPAGDGPPLAANDLSARYDAYPGSLAAVDDALLDESPEFYLWLASSEAVPFAME